MQACNHFRIGFPYNWKDYVDKYFGMNAKVSDSTKATVNEDCYRDSGNSCDIPNSLTQYPTRKIIDCLNAICKDIIAGEQGKNDTQRDMEANVCTSKNTNGAVPPKDGIIQGKATHDAKDNACNGTPPLNDAPLLRSPVESSKQSVCNGSMKSSLDFSASLTKVSVHDAEEKTFNSPLHVNDAPVVTSPMGTSKQSDSSSTDTFTSLWKNTERSTGCRKAIPAADPRVAIVSNATPPVNDCPGMNSPVDGSKPFSMKSSLHCATSSDKGTGPKKEAISTVVLGLATGKQRIKPSSVSSNALKDTKGITISSPDTGTKSLLNRSLLPSGGESKKVAPDEDQLNKATHHGAYSPQGASMPESNVEAEKAPGIQLQKKLVKPPRYDEAQISTRAENRLKKRSMESSSLPVAQRCVSMNRDQVESGGIHDQDGASVGFAGTLSAETNNPAERSHEASKDVLGHEGRCLAGKMCLVTPMTTVTRKSPRKQLSFVDKVVLEKAFLSFDAERREAPWLSKSDTGQASLASVPEAHQSEEDVDLNLVFPSRINFGFEGLSPEPSNNEAGNLPLKSPGEMKGCASSAVSTPNGGGTSTALDEVSISAPHVESTMSKPPDSRVSSRRSERLGKDKGVRGDSQKSFEPGEMDRNGSGLMAARTRNKKGIRGSPPRERGGTESHSEDPGVPSVEGQKQTFSSHKTLNGCERTSTRRRLCMISEDISTLSSEKGAESPQESSPRTRRRSLRNDRKEKVPGSNLSNGDGFVFSENGASSSIRLTKYRSRAAALGRSATGSGVSHVSGLAGDINRSEAPVDFQPSKKKPSVRTPKSVKKAHSASKVSTLRVFRSILS